MTPLTQESAELLAIEALSWLITNDELLPIFLNSTGADVSEFRASAQDPEFLGAVLDFLLMDDTWISAFCESNSYNTDFPLRARAVLPGGADANWT
ncbi:MAG: DUF3572 domain-containing protein [Boseongicola sp.]